MTGAVAGVMAAAQAPQAWALPMPVPTPGPSDPDVFSPRQSSVFRDWFTFIVDHQLHAGPTPRWVQRDCAGLVRFAVGESLRAHDMTWLRANGMVGSANLNRLPPPLILTPEQRSLSQRWHQIDGSVSAYAPAITLIQSNSRFIAKDVNQALPADLLFFDQGDDQHLMIWLDNYIAYHTGTVTPTDNGLRAVSVDELVAWNDSRWRPIAGNPNFVGVFRLEFLTP